MKVVMYSLDGCGHCVIAKDYFVENNIEYTELKVGADESADVDIDDFLDQFPDQEGFPHIMIDDVYVADYQNHIEMNDMLKGVSL